MVRSLVRQLVIKAVEINDTGEVGRIANIHRVSQCLYAGLWLVLASLQIFEDNIIGIIGSNKAFDRQSHLMTEEGRADIAKIAAGDTHHELISLTQSLHPSIGIKVIECLRKETGHIDGVGRS